MHCKCCPGAVRGRRVPAVWMGVGLCRFQVVSRFLIQLPVCSSKTKQTFLDKINTFLLNLSIS